MIINIINNFHITYCNRTVTDFVYLFNSCCSSSLKASHTQEKASLVELCAGGSE